MILYLWDSKIRSLMIYRLAEDEIQWKWLYTVVETHSPATLSEEHTFENSCIYKLVLMYKNVFSSIFYSIKTWKPLKDLVSAESKVVPYSLLGHDFS